MTQSEEQADEWYENTYGILLEKNGWPDRWNLDINKKPLCVEYKIEGTDLTDQQLMMRDYLIKAGFHYQLVLIPRNGEPSIVFDSNHHKIA